MSIHFVAIHSSAAENRKKITKSRYFGDSKSLTVVDVNTTKTGHHVLVMIVYVPSCNHFHAGQANIGK